ncbi:nuclear transport factor 2 family protein [Ectobacillus ponti]|uniref:Nuclear transport factor 2 family protein n=1 Tax=Ectobacillus ponti TaxID=2961894 RepID=A0AA41X999_9BACI|nr:nuclear transport factor 2 family protein [Ectobacillus ponti]MCP8971162.1 nuclear transport factor 2 family protein [Ectobacillus ponti]
MQDAVQWQLDAYNSKDVEKFLQAYTDDVTAYDHPDMLLFSGKEAMRERYSKLFSQYPNMHCELVHRARLGSHVMDHERITGRGGEPIEALATYELQDGLIKRIWFIK